MNSIYSKELKNKISREFGIDDTEALFLLNKADDSMSYDFLKIPDDVKDVLNDNEVIFNEIAWKYIEKTFNEKTNKKTNKKTSLLNYKNIA